MIHDNEGMHLIDLNLVVEVQVPDAAGIVSSEGQLAHLKRWNWETGQVQVLVGLTARAGSTPVFGIATKGLTANHRESFLR